MSHPLGALAIVPAIPIIVKAIPAVLSFLGGKKKKKAEQRAQEYAASEQAIAAGQAVAATQVMTDRDLQILRDVWPQVRSAANWTDINWSAIGMPQGPQLSPAADAAIKHVWPQVHVAARFDDVNWTYHSVPVEKVASLLPVPELPDHMQPPTVAQPITPGNFVTDPQGRTLVDSRTGQPIQAGMLGADIPKEYLIAGGVGLALLLILSQRR